MSDGCSHSCTSDLGGYGYCLECGERVTLKPEKTLREQTAYQFRLAKSCFRSSAYPCRRGSPGWLQVHARNRQWAQARLDAWAALRRLELMQAGVRVAAE